MSWAENAVTEILSDNRYDYIFDSFENEEIGRIRSLWLKIIERCHEEEREDRLGGDE